MQTKSVMRAEWLYLSWVAVNFISVARSWPDLLASPDMQQATRQLSSWFPYAAMAILVVLLVAIGLSATRRRSQIARWIIVALGVFGLWQFIGALFAKQVAADLYTALGLLSVGCIVGSAWLLFRPDATAWFRGGNPA